MASIDLALFPPFIAVAELGSFTAAAKRMRVERSSVSRSVARLEAIVGTTLIHRTTRQVALSSAGKALYARLRDPLAGLEEAIRDVAGLAAAPGGRLVITAPADFGAAFLSGVVARFARLYPAVDVDVRLTSALLDFIANGVDAAVRISMKRLKDSTMKVSNIGRISLGVFASPAYLEHRGTPSSPSATAGHDWVVFQSTRSTIFTGSEGSAELLVKGRVSCDDMFFVHHAVLNGVGLGVLPTFLAESDVARGRLVHLFPSWTASSGKVWFVTPASQRAPRVVTAFRDVLVESLTQKELAAQ